MTYTQAEITFMFHHEPYSTRLLYLLTDSANRVSFHFFLLHHPWSSPSPCPSLSPPSSARLHSPCIFVFFFLPRPNVTNYLSSLNWQLVRPSYRFVELTHSNNSRIVVYSIRRRSILMHYACIIPSIIYIVKDIPYFLASSLIVVYHTGNCTANYYTFKLRKRD